jgi:hypothetical protein
MRHLARARTPRTAACSGQPCCQMNDSRPCLSPVKLRVGPGASSGGPLENPVLQQAVCALSSSMRPIRPCPQSIRRACPEQTKSCRRDGWTIRRQLDFLDMLARTRSVTKAARAAGMSRESAHRLRNREPHGLFAAAWDRAVGADRSGLSRTEIDQGHIRAVAAACGIEGANLRLSRAHDQNRDRSPVEKVRRASIRRGAAAIVHLRRDRCPLQEGTGA